MTVLLFIKTVDTEVGNRLLVINFQPVQVHLLKRRIIVRIWSTFYFKLSGYINSCKSSAFYTQ